MIVRKASTTDESVEGLSTLSKYRLRENECDKRKRRQQRKTRHMPAAFITGCTDQHKTRNSVSGKRREPNVEVYTLKGNAESQRRSVCAERPCREASRPSQISLNEPAVRLHEREAVARRRAKQWPEDRLHPPL